MPMATIDIILILIYFILSIAIALALTRRASGSREDFFLSGRRLPWWLAGTAMVATTFAADTPLAVTEMVVKNGIAGNWLWWNMVAGSVLTVFFFAKLWRRADVLTDVEFIELRYSGKPAAFLRAFKAVYLGVFMNVIIMGWVNLAMASILKIIFGIDDNSVLWYIIGSMLIVGIYSAVSGLWGIAFTDMFQFIIAMAGCIVLAVVIAGLPEIGGISGLMASLPGHVFNFFPSVSFTPAMAGAGVMALPASAFIAHIAVQWWSSWYPGNEPGGGGYVAQRMMSSRDERHSLLATLWFAVAHYALRPWPWIIVALASLVLYPNIRYAREGYILAMRDHLPPGLLGFLVASFLAAYMSTIATHLNWGSSYLINDLYRRFIKRDAGEKHYVLASRAATLVLVVLSSILMKVMTSITGAWEFIIECGAGLGLVLILRWYWWRINAWSEIAAMIAPILAYGIPAAAAYIRNPGAGYSPFMPFPESLFFIAGVTTIAWLAVTYITKPVAREKLIDFYNRVRPGGPGWRKIGKESKEGEAGAEPLSRLLINWLLGIMLVYASLFSIGKLIFQYYLQGCALAAAAILLFIVLAIRLRNGKG
ncbi:MAG: sodium:proline symporter [Spirochaetes bacterium RBG_16_49_21]|nr:MAG: sodium:proline symporter [Spirochaetes bacterium RBG_16_49_21]